ncbi:MAG: FprA family A-type flavoprotein [Deltaproteobacteria bacterium]|nr:FprA family A-type flavoprotein [Deltaproteobacteria bacterium]
MKARKISNTVTWLGAIDWDRRLFDSLIPLPDGTTYNAYLVRGDSKTALIDTVDPSMAHVLLRQLEDVPQVDYVISNHAEKDHSGAIPEVLKRYPEAVLLISDRAVNVLVDSLKISHERIRVVKDNETVDLGGGTLEFLYTPWVHWPETMVTYLQEEGVLFSCDFLGCHIASSDLYVTDKARVAEAAKRYFAEIMMPFRNHIRKHLERLARYPVQMVAPSHGPIHPDPDFILDAYREWAADKPKNLVVIPFVSMHGSTEKMVDCLVESLVEKGVNVERYDLAVADIGKLATALVDAATIVVATPTVLGGPHPLAAYAAVLANALKPKAKYLSVIGSYGWGGKSVEALAGMIPNLNVEVVEPYLTKGSPDQIDCDAIDKLASAIAERHASL